jgi:hypothetical protein
MNRWEKSLFLWDEWEIKVRGITVPHPDRTCLLRLCTEEMAHKWGFGDGDILDTCLEGLKEAEVLARDVQELLISGEELYRLLNATLLAELRKNHDIEVEFVTTIHNPVRLIRADDKPIHCLEDTYALRPAAVHLLIEAGVGGWKVLTQETIDTYEETIPETHGT